MACLQEVRLVLRTGRVPEARRRAERANVVQICVCGGALCLRVAEGASSPTRTAPPRPLHPERTFGNARGVLDDVVEAQVVHARVHLQQQRQRLADSASWRKGCKQTHGGAAGFATSPKHRLDRRRRADCGACSVGLPPPSTATVKVAILTGGERGTV